MTGTNDRWLAAADQLLRSPNNTVGWWPRACACLIRMSLETGLDAFWKRTHPPIAACRSRRAQLIILRRYTARDTARRATYVWASLSAATHHHCYDLAPTASELRNLHTEAVAVLRDLQAPVNERTAKQGEH